MALKGHSSIPLAHGDGSPFDFLADGCADLSRSSEGNQLGFSIFFRPQSQSHGWEPLSVAKNTVVAMNIAPPTNPKKK
jgi:hypothetical protein